MYVCDIVALLHFWISLWLFSLRCVTVVFHFLTYSYTHLWMLENDDVLNLFRFHESHVEKLEKQSNETKLFLFFFFKLRWSERKISHAPLFTRCDTVGVKILFLIVFNFMSSFCCSLPFFELNVCYVFRMGIVHLRFAIHSQAY